eukprot:CAMPEP_0176430336 /NCGR_PEP_ID=MMETSP0127-20121128/14191_1 /TAXON_ID=938130 /ORGANISM="Platyophrya macrostoma, Strain WH" /LENGTH=634 /DNA_ID=CAMNT_0017812203 /DNA_START=8 /DNA_END=1912 /DNA_ORIENTATION=-
MTMFSNRSSFFDDDDLRVTFNWEDPLASPSRVHLNNEPILSETFNYSQANSQTFSAGYFSLYQKCLVRYKNSSSKEAEAILDISHSKLQVFSNGFSLTKNGNTFDFTSKNDTVIKIWVTQLKGICVLVTFHDDYKALKMIGRGSFAKVYLVESKTTGHQFAVKAFTKEGVLLSNKNNAKTSIINEIDIMRCITHENIIKLYEVYESERSIYLVLELIQGKSLQDAVKKTSFRETYSEIKVINMARSILDALAYLASKGIMHRDLKPDNILLDKQDRIKIADFGLATYVKLDTYIFKKCGTPGYIAPEVFKYDEKNPLTNYNERCDVFSAGCILFYMLFGYPFFDGKDGSEILQINRKYTNEFDSIAKIKQELKNPNTKISRDGLNLLLDLLEFDQKKRKQASTCLEHQFFTPVPTDMRKLGSNSGSNSQTNSPKSGNDSQLQFALSKQNSINYPKEKYEQKDSLYIDVGAPLLNGKMDTLTASVGSHNNSVLMGSNPNSVSKFAKGGKTGGNDLRKLAIMKNNMQNPNSDDESPVGALSFERSSSFGSKPTRFSPPKKEKTSDESDDETPNENPQVQKNVDKISAGSPDKHPSKMMSSSKRYNFIENRSTSNSPKVSNMKGAGFSRFEEFKNSK